MIRFSRYAGCSLFALVGFCFIGLPAWASDSPDKTALNNAIAQEQWPRFPSAPGSPCADDAITTQVRDMQAEEKSGDYLDASLLGKDEGDQLGECYGAFHHPMYHLAAAYFYSQASIDHVLAGKGPLIDVVRLARSGVDALSSYSIPSELQGAYDSVSALVAKAEGEVAQSASPSAQPVSDRYVVAEALLTSDAFFSSCQVHHVPADTKATLEDVQSEFQCSYRAHDYRAVEVLGEAMLQSRIKLDQQGLYWLANSFYKRDNTEKALEYAREAYSRLSSKDKARCQSNANHCAELRHLLASIEPSYRTRFAAEDSSIRAEKRQAAADAAEAAREAAATAFEDSGSGIHSTEAFHVNGSWELQWSYDCSSFSDGTGNFIVNVDGDVSDVLVSQLGSGDSGTEYVHHGGNVYFEINSECNWTVKALND